MNQFKKPLAMLLALVMLCGAFLSDGKLAFAEGEPEPTVIDVTEGEKPDGTPAGDVREAGAPAGDPTPEPTQEPVPEYTVTFVVGEDSFPVTVAENADATVPEGANAAITAYEKANNQVFVGWDKGFTSIVADTEVTAQFATATATLTIHYVDDSGEQLRASYEAVLAIGAEYSVASPEIQGYVVESGKETVSGTMAAGGVTVDVKYSVTDAKYTVQHYVEQIDGSFIKEAEETFSAQTGTTVTAVAKSYEGCTAPSPMPSAMVAAEGTVIAVYYTRNTYTVSFDANGGSYVSSIFDVKHGAKVAAPAEPTRAGYTFAGWLNGETAFDFINTPVTGNLTLTAKWEPKLVNYTVVYWQENADDDGYSYVETATKRGYAGSEATFDEKDYAHFVVSENSDYKLISGDGSTILNVYYDREEYTLTFVDGDGDETLICGKQEHTHSRRCYEWVLVCEKWHWHNESCYERRLTCNQEEHTHTDACYASDSGVIYTITAKYDADISHIWSDPAITAYSDEGYVWKSSVTGKYYSFLEKMPGQNITLTATKWEGNKYTWYYYLEVLPGQNTTGLTLRTDGGRTYYLYNTTTVYGNDVSLTYDEDYFPITGFRQRDKNVPSFTNRIAYLYYLRESYKLDFINGTTEKSETVAFEASIADKGYTPTVRPEGVAADAVFAGWYDNGDFMGEPYDFTDKTMPAKNLVFYAKWASRTYTVTFMNGTAEVGKLSDVAYGTNVSAQAPSGLTPPAEGVQFAGWANASGATADMTVTGDVTFYAKWHTTQTYGYTVKYVDANGTEIAETESFTGTPNTTVIAQAKEIAGYELNDAQSKSVLLDADNKEIVFKYRYIGTYSYTVRYLLKDTETEVFNPKVVTNVSSRTVTENAKYKDGYKLVSDTPQTITLSSDASKNVITFYYEKLGEQTMIRYWVKHVIDNGDGTTTLRAIEMKNEAVDKGKSLTVAEADVEKKTFEGYKYDRADTLPSTFTDNSSSNIITLYYVKDETQTKTLSYTVEHYLDNALQTADTMTVEEKVWVLDPATTLTVTQESVAHKNYTNAVFTHSDPATIPGAIQNGGVIKLYYVTKTAITITAKSDSKTYDGTALVNGGYDLTGTLKAGDTLDVTVSGSVTNVADSSEGNNVITSVKVLRNGIDVTAQYTINKVPGTLTINQRPVTFTGETATKPYTGSEQKITGITPDGLLSGHTYTGLTYSAKGTNVGGYDGAFSGTVKIMNGNADVTGNYAVTETPGKLTITAVTGEVTVTIKENSATHTYDGTEKTVTGYTVTNISNTLYSESDFAFNGTASVSGTSEGFYPMTLTASDFENKNENFTNVTFKIVDGGLTINPTDAEVIVTITENSATYTYDGTEKTATGYTVTSISNPLYTVNDFAFSGTASASGTNEGFYPMQLTVNDFRNTNGNFTNVAFVIVDGGLTINPVSDKVTVTITENSATHTYDGTEKTVTGYTTSISNPLYTVDDFAFNGTASVSGMNEGFYPMTLAASDFRNTNTNFANVEFVIVDGGLTINPITDEVTVTITENSATHTYDGTEKTVTGYTVTSISNGLYTASDFTFSGTASASGTEADFYPMQVKADDFTNKNTNFSNVKFVIVDGGLTITPIETPIVITADSNEKEYDGTALTDSGYTYTEGVLVSGDVLTAVVAGSQTDAGSSANKVTSYKVMRGEEEVTANYTFGDSVDGTLKVTPRAITITVSDASKLFGTADPIFTGSITKGELVNEGDLGTIEYYRINAGVEAVGTYNAVLSAKLKEENGNYAVTVVNGSFTIYLPEPEPIIPTPTPDIPLDVPQTGDGAMLHTIIGFACIVMAGLLGKLRRKENEGEA